MADMNDHPGQAGERLAPVNDAALLRSITDLQSVVNDGVLPDEIENWPSFGESLALCLHELRRLQAEAASAQPATRLAPHDWDVQMLLHGVLLGCPCCNGTPSTFSRHFAHTGIYQSYVHCSRCDVQVFKNAYALDEARQLAVATWSMRPDMPATSNMVEPVRESTKPFAPSRLTCFLLGGVICSLLAVLVQGH